MKIVRLIKLPHSVRGLTVPDPDGNYNIFINSNLGYDLQLKTYLHEVKHIECDDFSSCEHVSIIEKKAK